MKEFFDLFKEKMNDDRGMIDTSEDGKVLYLDCQGIHDARKIHFFKIVKQ